LRTRFPGAWAAPRRPEHGGWHSGSDSRWSTNHRGKKLFDHKEEAEPVARTLREPYPQEFLDGL
jgi:hypothetical protein